MGCSTVVVKYLVFFFNLIFAIAGGGLLALGVIIKLRNDGLIDFIPEKYHLSLPPLALIIIGAIVFVTAFFGCCGAVKESTCMLTTFAIILLTLLIIQVAVGAFAFIQIGDTVDLKSSVRQAIEKNWNQYNTSTSAKEAFNSMQTDLECCGVNSTQDYNWLTPKGRLPDSCCKTQMDCTVTSVDCFRVGCSEAGYKWIKNGFDMLGILAIVVAAFEIIGAIFALCLSSSIKNQIRREAYA